MHDHHPIDHCSNSRCDAACCHLSAWCAQEPLGDFEAALTGIHSHSAWLQESPHTTTEIMNAIFSNEALMDADRDYMTIGNVGEALFESGYTPDHHDDHNATWHWLEGAAIPVQSSL